MWEDIDDDLLGNQDNAIMTNVDDSDDSDDSAGYFFPDEGDRQR